MSWSWLVSVGVFASAFWGLVLVLGGWRVAGFSCFSVMDLAGVSHNDVMLL